MTQVPDAPWIRESEMYGYPPYEEERDPECPICGRICEDLYETEDGDIVGCNCCVKIRNAAEWLYDHQEEYEP